MSFDTYFLPEPVAFIITTIIVIIATFFHKEGK